MPRSVWKGPFVDSFVLKKAEKSRESGRNEVMLEDYASVLVPEVGHLHRRRVRIRVERIDGRNRLYGKALGAIEMVGS